MSMYACKYVYLRSCGQSIPQTCVREANPHRFHSDAGGELQDLGPFSRFTVHVFFASSAGGREIEFEIVECFTAASDVTTYLHIQSTAKPKAGVWLVT